MIKVGSDFSGVGAFNQALNRLGIQYKEIFACDMDKYARQTFIHNYGEPEYYPTNVYEREIPKESLDIYVSSPPCQAFSLAGKRLGKNDKRGILFFNSLEFIQVNKPRYFIFENVKGLLSDDGGKTFSEWVNYLGGKSVNGNAVIFPYEESVPYHLYWKVLNAKEHGVPQNRERVFLVGIRDDSDNNFRFPIEENLSIKLKDILQYDVDDKYFLSQKMIDYISKDRNGNENLIINRDVANAITCEIKKMQRSVQDNYINDNEITFDCKHNLDGCINTSKKHRISDLCTFCDNGEEFVSIDDMEVMLIDRIKIKSATAIGYEEATEGDSINFSVLNSETRRGRVGKGVAQTLDTACNQGVLNNYRIRRLTPRECFRLMDFPDTFTWTCSDSQAYRQAGNSIVVNVLYKILKNLNL